MSKKTTVGYTVAGDYEKSIFLQNIQERVSRFLEVAASSDTAMPVINEVKQWSHETQEMVESAFIAWFEDEVAGKKIPPAIQVPKPRQDRIYRKFGIDFGERVCAVCGDTRVLNIAHIIPRGFGGVDEEWNLLRLCANHHYLFDNHKLTEDEWNKIPWSDIDPRAKEYVTAHQRVAQLRFWGNGESG